MGSDVDLPQMVPTQEVDSSVVIPELDVVVVTPMTDDVVEGTVLEVSVSVPQVGVIP